MRGDRPMIVDDQHCWWAVARSEELKPDRPIGINCAGHAIATWREPDGTARAVEDSSPLTRFPAALGVIFRYGCIRWGNPGRYFEGPTANSNETPILTT